MILFIYNNNREEKQHVEKFCRLYCVHSELIELIITQEYFIIVSVQIFTRNAKNEQYTRVENMATNWCVCKYTYIYYIYINMYVNIIHSYIYIHVVFIGEKQKCAENKSDM